MALRIETFSNRDGGNAFFKAIGHPLAADKAEDFLERLRTGRVAVYDPAGFAAAFAEIYDLSQVEIAGVFVQDISEFGKTMFGQAAQPVTDLKAAKVDKVLVALFDAGRAIDQIRHLIPDGAEVLSFDALRLPDDMLTDRRRSQPARSAATSWGATRLPG